MSNQPYLSSTRLIDRFLASTDKYPDRFALEKGGFKWTYAELREAAARIADDLGRAGDDRPFAAVNADKSPECYAGILGILMAGKAYLPLNPKFPGSRNRFMMEKAGVRSLIEGGRINSLSIPAVPLPYADPAYLLFTSGTTGEPKGVQVSNSNASAYMDFMLKTYAFSPEDRFTQNFDLTFDLSVHDLFLCWSAGACLCVPEDASSFGMAKFIREKQPTVWFSVPSVVMLMDRMRLLRPGAFPSIRHSFFCGEPLYAATVEAWRKAVPGSRIVNLYGPTEATIAISHYEILGNDSHIKQELGIVSIGKIFEGNSYLLKETENSSGKELCLTGEQVVNGYFLNDEADGRSFFLDEKFTGKCYKTGDLVRIDEEGDLFYLGRTDSEVKVSGYRVNLREIEYQICSLEGIEQVAALYDTGVDGRGTLHAFILTKNDKSINENEIDKYCRERMPWYMVPGNIIFVTEMPLNANGKVDKTALKQRYIHG